MEKKDIFNNGKMKKKKKTNEWYRKQCVIWAKTQAKLLVDYKCEYDGCGKSKVQGWQMHGSHIYSEGGHKGMSATIKNILCLCATHHVGGYWKNAQEPSWHEDPITMVAWFKNKFPERADELRIMAQHPIIVNWEKRYNDIKNSG